MLTNITLSIPETAVSAVQARQRFGELLDKTFYQGKSFFVERAGKFMAVLVPLSEYREMQRIKQQARDDFFAMTDEVRARIEQSGISDEELQAAIDEAVTEVRRESVRTGSRKA